MATPPQPRWTDLETLSYYLSGSGQSVPAQTTRAWMLASAERGIERYTRRRFTPYPKLRTDYQRQVLACEGQGQTNLLQLAGTVGVGYLGSAKTYLALPITAAQMQVALRTISGLGGVICAGGPLPQYPIDVYMEGVPNPTVAPQAMIETDSSGLGTAGWLMSVDAGFDSNPPVMLKFTTRGKTEIRMPDLREVSPSPDPRVPGSGGIMLYGRRLFPNQYMLGYNSYGATGADEQIGTGPYAEPATSVILGYGWGMGMTLAQQFAYVLPQMYLANDLWITGRWGWNPTPEDVVDTTYGVATRRYREKDAAFSDQMVTPEGIAFSFFKQLPASLKLTLDSYRVPNLALV